MEVNLTLRIDIALIMKQMIIAVAALTAVAGAALLLLSRSFCRRMRKPCMTFAELYEDNICDKIGGLFDQASPKKKKNGLSVKVSMKGALREQGFTSANKLQNEWSAWEERGAMIDILHCHDLSRDDKQVHREHLTVDEYKTHAAQKAEIRKTNEQINALKKKNPAELTPSEIKLIKNQNDIMRSKKTEYQTV